VLKTTTRPAKSTDQGPAPSDEASKGHSLRIDGVEKALQIVGRGVMQVRMHERILQSAGVRVDRSGASLLYKLRSHGDSQRVTELADLLGVDAPTVTRKIQQLEREGLVDRHPDPDDRRATQIHLTPAGKKTLDKVMKAKLSWLEGVLKNWNEEDLETFSGLLGRFAEDLEQDIGEARGN
jgi:DNA-binding MarR family transcriptional regulator